MMINCYAFKDKVISMYLIDINQFLIQAGGILLLIGMQLLLDLIDLLWFQVLGLMLLQLVKHHISFVINT